VLALVGANSGPGLRSMPVRYLFLDEIDAYPLDVDGEGDPVALAEKRTSTFARKKVLKVSTPTTRDFSRIETIRRAAEANLEVGAADDRFPVYPQRLVAEVRKAMPSDGIIALDNGVYKIWFARNYKAHAPNSVLLDNALATMGAGLPSAMAARLVYPEKKIIAICGDGGFMMNSQEIETAVRLGMQLVVVILRDDAYGMIRWKQANMGLTDWGLTYGNPDFVRYAESYGAHGHRVGSAAELGPMLTHCLNAPGFHLIDCPVDYTENDRILNNELKTRSAAL
jgi:acetolactate synthase-1/2/3 large subunit